VPADTCSFSEFGDRLASETVPGVVIAVVAFALRLVAIEVIGNIRPCHYLMLETQRAKPSITVENRRFREGAE